MKKKTLSIVLTLLTTSMLAVTLFTQMVKPEPGTVIIVPDHYPSIQEALYAADPGDEIMVRNGTYHEWITVNQTVSIFAEYKHGALVDGLNIDNTIFRVIADNVSITDFRIRNAGNNPSDSAGISLENVDNCFVANNVLTENFFGVLVSLSNNNSIIGNFISSDQNLGYDVADGIYLSSSTGNYVAWNNASANKGDGMRLVNSNYTIITENIVAGNGYSGPSSYGNGILFYHSYYNTITGNNITDNQYGGIDLDYDTPDNIFYHNNFINNGEYHGKQVVTRPGSYNTWDDGYPSGGNYWSDYEERYPDAKERDGSGIWDTPYVIDPDPNNIDRFPLIAPYPTERDMIPPEIISVDYMPTCPPPLVDSSTPRAGEPVYVEANVSDPSGVDKVSLCCRADGGEWWITSMHFNLSAGLWTATIPGQPSDATVEFFLQAFDIVGNEKISFPYTYNVEIAVWGDINGDGQVGVEDLYILGNHYGETSP